MPRKWRKKKTEIVNSPLLLIASGALLTLIILIPLMIMLFRAGGRGGPGAPSEGELLDRESLRRLEELSGKMEELGRIFIVPKTRGGLGETLLEELLGNWLPQAGWRRQYRFSDGTIADAVIRSGSFLVAVDAKFPLEQVSSLLEPGKGNADKGNAAIPARERKIFLTYGKTISEKYIKPEEGTLEFALLYIPSEHIYYRCFVEDPTLAGELWEFRVVPVGPSSLFLYLQSVALGLKGLKLPERARELASLIGRLKKELERMESSFATSSNHLKNLQNSFDESRSRLTRLSGTVERLSGDDEHQEIIPDGE